MYSQGIVAVNYADIPVSRSIHMLPKQHCRMRRFSRLVDSTVWAVTYHIVGL